MEDFGVIVACCPSDYLFAKGCCASIRHFLGEVPICLLFDGVFSDHSIKKIYGVKIIDHTTVKFDLLRQKSFGWGKTKMIGFWESPWKHFLMLDADTNIWGNILSYANFADADLIVDRPVSDYSDFSISHFFFEIDLIEKYFPGFMWQKYRHNYFCTGVFFGTRDSFSLAEYEEILQFTEQHPDVFKYGEMGFLNFMIFRADQERRLRIRQKDIQVLVPDFNQQDIKNRFQISKTGPVIKDNYASVIHWCGPKPTLSTSQVYAEPMTYFRRQYLKNTGQKTGLAIDAILRLEDLERNINVYAKKINKKLNIFSPFPTKPKV